MAENETVLLTRSGLTVVLGLASNDPELNPSEKGLLIVDLMRVGHVLLSAFNLFDEFSITCTLFAGEENQISSLQELLSLISSMAIEHPDKPGNKILQIDHFRYTALLHILDESKTVIEKLTQLVDSDLPIVFKCHPNIDRLYQETIWYYSKNILAIVLNVFDPQRTIKKSTTNDQVELSSF